LDAALQAEVEAASPKSARSSLPSVPTVRVKIDTRAVDESLKSRMDGPVVTLPAIKAPDGPPPQVDGRQANGFPVPPKHT